MKVERKRCSVIIFVALASVLLGLAGAPPGAASTAAVGGVTVNVLFPDEPGFAEHAADFTEETDLEPGPALAKEFDREPIGQFRSSNGLRGTLFEEALRLPALFLGKVTHVIYGTIVIPEGGRLRGRDLPGDYGIVVYDVPLVVALVARETGKLAAFIVTSVATPVPPNYVLSLLFRLITVPVPTQPPVVQPMPSFGFQLSIRCRELPTQQEIDIPVGSGEPLIEVEEFVVREAGLGSLAIESLGPALQFLVSAPNYLHLGFVWAKQEVKVAIPVGPEFTLMVQGEERRVCLQAAVVPADADGGYRIVGTAYQG